MSPAVFNGNWPQSKEPARQPASTATAPTAGVGRTYQGQRHKRPQALRSPIQGLFYGFPPRVTGSGRVQNPSPTRSPTPLGRSNSIRADQGQAPIAQQAIDVGSIAQTGSGVTINAPLSATVTGARAFTISQNFKAGTGAVIMGGPGRSIGDNVSIGAGEVVDGSSLGSGTTVGLERICSTRTFPANSNI